MKKISWLLCLLLTISVSAFAQSNNILRVEGKNIVKPNGEKLFIRGTNLGNWLNPEGYMFGFSKCNAGWMIDEVLREMVGPDEADVFWKAFKDNYVTRKDIEYIASTGANTIRLPFNYKLFTDKDYMGLSSRQDGFARIDSLVSWCRDNHLYLILDMHDCPGGQTGDNIDNSYGYPWLFESEKSQQLFCDIWASIARRYKNEPVILGYEPMNEPIAPYFDNVKELNAKLEPLYKRVVAAIRKEDSRHIILLGGAQWNGNFEPFSDWKFDSNIMYTCHRYGGKADKAALQNLIDFRDKTGLAMYMGETGHNTDEWQAEMVKTLEDNNIGYTFWPYKKVDGSCMVAVQRPADWDSVVVKFAEANRTTFKDMREARPNQQQAKTILKQYLENIKFDNCKIQQSYVNSLNLRAKK
jgi:aryl-phospho-beta-D-glucosidase BglC (GH1 family)